jgi:cation diffusion facilitator family transporter
VGIPGHAAIYVTIASIVVKILLSLHKMRIGKRISSSMLIADAKNMRNDVVISLFVLIGVGLTKLLGLAWIDSLTAILVSIWIIKVAFDIFLETNVELMDGIGDRQIYSIVFDAVDSVQEAGNPHKARIRKIGNMYAIVIDVEVDENCTVAEAHRISRKVEQEINRRVENIYDITVHIEPAGYVESDESFGLDRSSLD